MHTDSRVRASVDLLIAGTERMRAAVEQLKDDLATATPAGGGWTPAQIAYHVGLTNERFFLPAFSGEAPFLAPAPDGFTETFSFDTIPPKIRTFPQLEPPAVGRAEAIEKLRATSAQLAAAMQDMPEERLASCATLPFGTLSMQQMAEFAAAHVARHQAQLDRALAGVA